MLLLGAARRPQAGLQQQMHVCGLHVCGLPMMQCSQGVGPPMIAACRQVLTVMIPTSVPGGVHSLARGP